MAKRIVFECVLPWMLLFASSTMALSSDYPTSVDQFSGRFLQEAVKQADLIDKSVVISPFSADAVMSMVAMSAKGETQKQITDALSLSSIDEAAPSIKKTNEALKNIKGVTLKVANRIFTKPSADGKLDSVVPSYRSKIQDVFGSEVQQLDFSKSSEAADTINAWVEENTNHRIKNLISKDALSGSTAAVLVNAIYFKGSWDKKFDPSVTHKRNFTKVDGSHVVVDMMREESHFLHKYSEELNAKIVVLPYEGKEVSMVIILPNSHDRNGIEHLKSKLANGLNQHLENLESRRVAVFLPKMKMETKIDVKEVFSNLGVTNVFSSMAGLEMINGVNNLFVSDAVQKAFIECNEEGAEAAAATGIQISLSSLPPQVVCDHTFLFFIKTKDLILFSGINNGN